MAIQLLKAFFKTKQPYRSNFTQRYLLEKAPALDLAYQFWVTRPWLQCSSAMPIRDLKPGCCIGAIPHYRTGIGHVFSEWNTGFLWSMKLEMPFAHCPLRPPWNDFFGLAGLSDYESNSRPPGIRCVKLPPIPETENPAESPLVTNIINYYGQRKPTLFHLYYGQNSFRQDESCEFLRAKYFDRRKFDPVVSLSRPGMINVSVHVRRPTTEDSINPKFNDPNTEAHQSRYFPSSFFVRICQVIENTFGAGQVTFNIFSLGTARDFEGFRVLNNYSLHLNKDERETFHNLVIGDILLVSPSGFSFMAGLISTGFKIASHPWWHHIPDDSRWCRVEADGGNEETLNRFLSGAKDTLLKTKHQKDEPI